MTAGTGLLALITAGCEFPAEMTAAGAATRPGWSLEAPCTVWDTLGQREEPTAQPGDPGPGSTGSPAPR
jgi:hypothetical protein